MSAQASPPPTRVLVIDDEKGLRDMLSYFLRRLSCEVNAVETGEAGVDACRKADYDVVICDVMMAEMDGFAVLEILHREKPLLPVILVTGFPTDEAAEQATRLGAFDFLAKPYDMTALFALIESAAALKRARLGAAH